MSAILQRIKELRYKIIYVASPIFVLALWEMSARTGLIDARFFPPPTLIIAQFGPLFLEDKFHVDIGSSMWRITAGVALGFIPGAVLGMIMGFSRLARAFFAPLVALTYPIPKIAILPLLLIIFGLGNLSNIMVVTIGVFFLSLINTQAGVAQIPKIHFEVARVFRVSRSQIFWRIVLPASLPGVFTGLKLGVGYGLILIVAAEMVAANSGIGYRIWLSWELYLIKDIYACLITISIIGILLSVSLDKLEEKIVHWK
jgi:ABC-type nitrate/sulfonate/bicarbonate transport system permease component